MATLTARGTPLSDTANQSSYVTAVFTPVEGELLVVSVQATGTVASAPSLIATGGVNGLTFSRLPTTAVKATSADTQWFFVSNQFVPTNPSSMTLTFNCTQDAATGCMITPIGVAGMTKVGTAAVRQMGSGSNIPAGTAPSATFPAPCLAENPVIFAPHTNVQSGRNPPAGWTEFSDLTYTTPATGGGCSGVNGGFTGTTRTSTDSTSGNCSGLAIELDASGNIVSFSGWGVPI